jgi:cytochrome c5
VRIPTIALLLAFVAVFACCGGNGDSAPTSPEEIESQFKRDYEALARAFGEGDIDKVYGFIASKCHDEIDRDQIAGAALLASAFLGDDWEVRVDEVELLEQEGNTATIRVVSTVIIDGEEEEPSEETVDVVWEDGHWRDTDCNTFALDADADEDDDTDGEDEPELRPVAIGEVFEVEADALGGFGDEQLSGSIGVRVTEAEVVDAIESEYAGPYEAKGKFIVVHYEVTSDLNASIHPGWQINDNLRVTDERGRRWELADFQGDYPGLSGDAAEAAGCDDPSTPLGAGFATCTAAVFDVPEDATGLSLQWKEAGVIVDLGL